MLTTVSPLPPSVLSLILMQGLSGVSSDNALQEALGRLACHASYGNLSRALLQQEGGQEEGKPVRSDPTNDLAMINHRPN